MTELPEKESHFPDGLKGFRKGIDPGLRKKPGTILFLCTGNYYRSRMAEEIFNHYAEQDGLPYRAISRGLARIMIGQGNVGPMSRAGVESLIKLGIKPRNSTSYPRAVSSKDLGTATRVIALCKSEHEPMIRKRFPRHALDVLYWDIPDVGQMPVTDAAARIRSLVLELINSLNTTP